METWEIIARRIRRELAKTHRLELNHKKKEGRLYRTRYFERGFLPPPVGEEEILVTSEKVIVRNVGLDFYQLSYKVKKVLDDLEIGCLTKDSSEGIEYHWKVKKYEEKI